MKTKMTKEQFIGKIKNLHYVESITGKTYSHLTVSGNYCSGIRESTVDSKTKCNVLVFKSSRFKEESVNFAS